MYDLRTPKFAEMLKEVLKGIRIWAWTPLSWHHSQCFTVGKTMGSKAVRHSEFYNALMQLAKHGIQQLGEGEGQVSTHRGHTAAYKAGAGRRPP